MTLELGGVVGEDVDGTVEWDTVADAIPANCGETTGEETGECTTISVFKFSNI